MIPATATLQMPLPRVAARLGGEEQSPASARASQRVSADGCGSGRWFESCASRRATPRGPATVASLQLNAQSMRQGERRPNAKPQTLPARAAVPSHAAVGYGVRSPPAICRIDDTTTERTSMSSLLAPESQPRRAHATGGPISATTMECTPPNRDSAMEPLPARPGSLPRQTGRWMRRTLTDFQRILDPSLCAPLCLCVSKTTPPRHTNPLGKHRGTEITEL